MSPYRICHTTLTSRGEQTSFYWVSYETEAAAQHDLERLEKGLDLSFYDPNDDEHGYLDID